jgi:hypothetical protein
MELTHSLKVPGLVSTLDLTLEFCFQIHLVPLRRGDSTLAALAVTRRRWDSFMVWMTLFAPSYPYRNLPLTASHPQCHDYVIRQQNTYNAARQKVDTAVNDEVILTRFG